jgi:hypothetical protein
MKSKLELDRTRLFIFHEGRRRRVFVGELIYHEKENRYELIYDKNYACSKKSIPLGPGLDLFKARHISARGVLFPSLADRIPSKDNPAYEDYCKSQGISVNETSSIILLGSVGRRGPSSFIFEPVYKKEFPVETLLKCRKNLHISRHDFAMALGFSETTLQKVETLKSHDANILKLLQIYFDFPEVALWQLKQTGNKVKNEALVKLIKYFSY